VCARGGVMMSKRFELEAFFYRIRGLCFRVAIAKPFGRQHQCAEYVIQSFCVCLLVWPWIVSRVYLARSCTLSDAGYFNCRASDVLWILRIWVRSGGRFVSVQHSFRCRLQLLRRSGHRSLVMTFLPEVSCARQSEAQIGMLRVLSEK
jgi:hypothetical protein